MRQEYNKLVRDHIPTIIRSDGRECETATMSEGDYRQALRLKLVEEAQEVVKAEPEKMVKELADLYEVIDAIMATHGIERDEVRAEQKRRRTERGGFDKRIRLLWTD